MTHRKKFWIITVVTFVMAAIAGVIIGKTVPASGGVDNPALVMPALLALIAIVMAVSWVWWQKMDDLQKQGQLVSWWWGGTFGMLVMIVVMVVLTGRHSDLSLGATYMVFGQFAGMIVFWLGWKFRGRGVSE